MYLIAVEPLEIHDQSYIRIIPLQFIRELAVQLKAIKGSRWTKETGWYIPYSPDAWKMLQKIFGSEKIEIRSEKPSRGPKIQTETPSELSPNQQLAVLQLVEQLMLKRYSYLTVKAYRSCFTSFLSKYPDREPHQLEEKDIRQFMLNGIRNLHWSESYQNVYINAIKFYCEQVLGQPRKIYTHHEVVWEK
jgi:hypothetical protein